MIDNYDSFTYNLVQYLGELGAEVTVVRNGEVTVDEVERLLPDKIVISPGPCSPNEAGISLATITRLGGKITLLGVCLENVWPEVVEDAQVRRLKPRYQAADFHQLAGLPRPRVELMDFRRYRVKIVPTQTSRGCPYHCAFCEVPIVYGHTYRRRPIGEVIAEIKANTRLTGLKRSISLTTISPATGITPRNSSRP